MQTIRFMRLSGLALAVLLTLLVGSVQAEGRRGLEGTWLIETSRVNCDTRDPLSDPFPSVHTYLRGGTVLDIGAAPPLDPVVTHSAAHGIW